MGEITRRHQRSQFTSPCWILAWFSPLLVWAHWHQCLVDNFKSSNRIGQVFVELHRQAIGCGKGLASFALLQKLHSSFLKCNSHDFKTTLSLCLYRVRKCYINYIQCFYVFHIFPWQMYISNYTSLLVIETIRICHVVSVFLSLSVTVTVTLCHTCLSCHDMLLCFSLSL